MKQPRRSAVAERDTGSPRVAYSAAVALFSASSFLLFQSSTMTILGTPLSPSATRVMLLGSGELGKEVLIAL